MLWDNHMIPTNNFWSLSLSLWRFYLKIKQYSWIINFIYYETTNWVTYSYNLTMTKFTVCLFVCISCGLVSAPLLMITRTSLNGYGYGYGLSCQSALLYLSVLWDQMIASPDRMSEDKRWRSNLESLSNTTMILTCNLSLAGSIRGD